MVEDTPKFDNGAGYGSNLNFLRSAEAKRRAKRGGMTLERTVYVAEADGVGLSSLIGRIMDI